MREYKSSADHVEEMAALDAAYRANIPSRRPVTTVTWRNWFLGIGWEDRGVIVSLGPLSFFFPASAP